MDHRTRTKPSAAALLLAVAGSAIFLLSASYSLSARAQQPGDNGPPVVRITAPVHNTTYPWNSLVSYSIVVTWRGKSTQYQEIPAKDVLLHTTYIPDLAAMPAQTPPARPPAGLLAIVNSNCIGCHQFKAKAMGPSFAAIATRYPDNPASIETLSRYIHDGSTGVWGPTSMPPHPEFTQDQLHAMALWIVKNAANPNVQYYVGTEGALRMEAPPAPGPHAGLILTATYTAPAAGAEPPFGEDTVILHGK